MYWAVPVLATLATIGSYQYFNEKLDIKNIMTGLYIFGLLQLPMSYVPYCISCIIDTLISFRRIEVLFKKYNNNNKLILIFHL